MKNKQVEELILQSLEHELGGIQVYKTAIRCAQNSDLKSEFVETIISAPSEDVQPVFIDYKKDIQELT